MGALTLKSFPFELRGWDIEKFEGIDPTDGFGSNTKIYIKNNQIIQIEPDYNVFSLNNWLTDKGRQFFDGIFDIVESKQTAENLSWPNILKSIQRNLYFFDHCNAQSKKIYFFTVVFENLSIEVISLLNIISQNYSFIRIRKAENIRLNNDLETFYQLGNSISEKEKLSSSTLCLLVNNNPRYEGYQLNIKLKQRLLKGNFRCFVIGSILNLTFPVSFLGSNTKVYKTIAEGNHLICQDFKSSKNPLVVFNSEIYKRTDGTNVLKMLKVIKNSNIFTKNWNGLHILNSSLNETGIYSTAQFLPLSLNDFVNYSSLYFLNTTIENFPNLKRIIELKTLNLSSNKFLLRNIKHLILNQNYYNQIPSHFIEKSNLLNQYVYLPTNMFYENNETFINTEGFIKRTTKLVFQKKAKNNWQILRKLFKSFKKDLIFTNNKDNEIIYFNATKLTQYKNFISFQFYAVQNLSNINYYFKLKNKPFSFYQNKFSIYKIQLKKIHDTKLKYWLDDFFVGGKDEYSQYSTVLNNCSRIFRAESANFF